MQALDVDNPLLVWLSAPSVAETLSRRIRFEDKCEYGEASVVALHEVVATVEQPAQIVEGSNSNASLVGKCWYPD